MTKMTPLLRLEKKVSASDLRGILDRWRFGRALLADSKLTTTVGHLRPDVAPLLVNAAAAAGLKLSEREVRRRLQCARAYPSEDAVRRAAAEFEGWTALADAGFPHVEDQVDDDGPAAGRQRAAAPGTDPWEQPALDDDDASVFPRKIKIGATTLDRDACTLKTLADFVADRERWTAAHARKNAERRAHLDALIQACNGDLTVTYRAAVTRVQRATTT